MTRGGRVAVGPSAALVLLTLGGALAGCAAGLVACTAVAATDGKALGAFALTAAATGALAAACLTISRKSSRGLTVRPVAGLLAVTVSWLGAGAVGAAVLLAAGTFTSPLDAYFEATSGFTTSGATMLAEIEPQPDAVLLWRSVMQWLGGVGIVVLVVAVAPVTGPAVQRAFYAETTGITHERLTPRIIDTAKIIAGIYVALSAAAMVAYALAGMGGFDALNHGLTTVATGGFSTRTDSIGAFDSVPIELVGIVFMVLGGVNFAFYWRAVRRRPLMPQGSEVLAFLAILAGAIAVITFSVEASGDATLREAAFNVTSIVTSTGYATTDYDAWNQFARVGLLVLMSSGACAASTAGGIKVIRTVLLTKAAGQEIQRPLNPSAVRVLRFGGHPYSEDVRRAVLGFFLVYSLIYVAGSLAMAATGVDPVTAISAASSSLNIIGPGLGEVGPDQSWQALPDFGRGVAIVLMIVGRLEVFTVVALLAAMFTLRR